MHNTEAQFQDYNVGCFCVKRATSTPYDTFFAKTQVFLSKGVISNIERSINVLEKTITSEIFKEFVFKDRYNEIKDSSIHGGVIMSYDFHIDGSIPKLIEINTNAGGVFLNYELLKAVHGCCAKVTSQDVSLFEKNIVEMFKEEFAVKSSEPLKTVAIIDEEPEKQFLYPEFLLCKEILEHHGIQVYIVDPKNVTIDGDTLLINNVKIDLVYNRLTDFYFQKDEYLKFMSVLTGRNTVITPNKDDHMLFADKINLLALGDEGLTSRILSSEELDVLKSALLETKIVDQMNAGHVWENRKNYFFKPFNGFGGRGAYNGKGITKQVWENIKEGGYLAQEIIPANVRTTLTETDKENYKFDIRAYTYKGKVLLLAARMYQGQTTNFRTTGGGFAPILITDK